MKTAQMLAFAARHGIQPVIELFPMAEADWALNHVRQGEVPRRARGGLIFLIVSMPRPTLAVPLSFGAPDSDH